MGIIVGENNLGIHLRVISIKNMKIMITRHRETIEGLRGEALGGRKHGHLAPSGIEQARALAKNLREEKFDAIYSSYLQRAKDTTLEIA